MQTLKTSKSYRIQLTGGQLLWVGALSAMSLGVSFYLGLVTGNSLRPPINNTVLQESIGQPSVQEVDSIKTVGRLSTTTGQHAMLTPEQLDFFNKLDKETKDGRSSHNPQEKKTVISSEKLNEIKKTTSRLQQAVPQNTAVRRSGGRPEERAKTIAKREETPVKTEGRSPKPVNKSENSNKLASTSTGRPAALVSSKQVGVFTLQVFTSSNKKKAEDLVKRLIESGYLESYLQSFENSEKRVLYRVRVGKTDKSSVESLAEKIKKLSYIEHVQIRRL